MSEQILLSDGLSFYEGVLAAIFLAAIAAFSALLFVSAPYGRFARDGWGLRLPEWLAWFLMEIPSFLAITITALFGRFRSAGTLLLLALWCAHYLYRSVVYPLLLPSGRRKSMPLAVMLMAVLYNIGNGFVNGYGLFHLESAVFSDPGATRVVIGVVIFAIGAATHVGSDAHLRELRRAGEGEYSIPVRGLFRLVSCPNYLGEIVQWTGFAVAAGTLPALSFAVFTTANLLPRALATHRWYRETFVEYPRSRKALVPWIV